MQYEPNDRSEGHGKQAPTDTLYALAMKAMKQYIDVYLELSRTTNNLTQVGPNDVQDFVHRFIVLGGINSPLDPSSVDPEQVVQEWQRMRAIPFDVESAVTKGVYIQLRNRTENLLDELGEATQAFLEFDPVYISANPHMLPILQRLANIASKAELKRQIGNVSDNAVSSRAAERLAEILNQRKPGRTLTRERLLQSVEPTLEGIVRDLVGRLLLESIVANALDDSSIPYKRESEYKYIEGVVYNFRADFVIPDDNSPKAFIEVRKSSSRHASLYAKDKMFSAINWKGKNKDLLAILVVDGPWTAETLRIMTKVFDYVVPISMASDISEVVSSYLDGDRSKLKWLIDFAINISD